MTTQSGAPEALVPEVQSALSELDRGLRSENAGEKLESVARMPELLERYAFPLFTNAAFIKLCDAFAKGSNELRSCIVHTVQQLDGHMDKIISIEQITMRLMTVTHSNDPLARTYTLRMFACLAKVLINQSLVHHLIASGITVDNKMEQHAAIVALQRFCQYSSLSDSKSSFFAAEVVDSMLELLASLGTPSDTKQLLAHTFTYMHFDPHTTDKVFRACRGGLETAGTGSRLNVCLLRSLTVMSQQSLTIVHEMLSLLLRLASSGYAERLRVAAVHNLRHVQPQHWATEHIQGAVKLVSESHTQREPYQLALLGSLSALSARPSFVLWQLDADGTELSSTVGCVVLRCPLPVAVHAALLLTNISCLRTQSNTAAAADVPADSATQLSLMLQFLLDQCTRGAETEAHISRLLGACLRVCQSCAFDRVVQSGLFDTMLATANAQLQAQLAKSVDASETDVSGVLCVSALCDVHPCSRQPLHQWALLRVNECPPQLQSRCVWLLRRLLLLLRTPDSAFVQQEQVVGIVEQCTTQWSAWQTYRVARLASCSGWHSLAAGCFGLLAEQVVERSWLHICVVAAAAEHKLLTEGVLAACNHYTQAYTHAQLLESSYNTEQSSSVWFACRYVRLRHDLLLACHTLNVLCKTSHMYDDDDPAYIDQVCAVADMLCGVRVRWSQLLDGCLDADSASLQHVLVMRALTAQLADALTRLAQKQDPEATCVTATDADCLADDASFCNGGSSVFASEHSRMQQQTAGRVAAIVSSDVSLTQGVRQLQALVHQVLLSQPLLMPRAFYQRPSHTRVKLKLASQPPPNAASNSVAIVASEQLHLQLEGIIINNNKRAARRCAAVLVRTRIVGQAAAAPVASNTKTAPPPPNSNIERRIPLAGEYFSTEFLLDVQQTCTVRVDCSLVDTAGRVWTTGARCQLPVNVFHER